MKYVIPLALASLISGCVSFEPLEVESYKKFKASEKTCSTEVCKAREYAAEVSHEYKSVLRKHFKSNSDYDSWILNLATVGIGAEVSNLHSDVLKTSVIGIGYQSARKTYDSIPFQLRVYTVAMKAAQCVYDESEVLQKGASDLSKIKDIVSDLDQSLSALDGNPSLSDQMIKAEFPFLIDYATVREKITHARDMANQARDTIDGAEKTISKAVQKIDNDVLEAFTDQLPNIDEIKNQLREQALAELKQEEQGTVTETHGAEHTFAAPLVGGAAPPYAALEGPIKDALNSINDLAQLRVNRLFAAENSVKGCVSGS